jgi:4-amino-4-deoxy-L-arabinose transferase-like glycosyltransferase
VRTRRLQLINRLRPLSNYAILLLWCLFLFGYGIDAGNLYRTEALRAIIGREALNGHWLVPTLYGEPFLTKPPGMYVAIGAASLPFGDVTTLSARIPSAIAATVTVFLFFAAFRRVVDGKLALAGVMLMPVSFLWLEKAPSAEIDMLQLAWVSAALLCFWRAIESEESFTFRVRPLETTVWWILALLCTTAGFLTKWTAPAFFYLTVVAMLYWRGQLRLLLGWRHLLALGMAIGLCALWASAVARQVGWQVLINTFVAEASQRFGSRHSRSYPWVESLAYPLQILGANAPWSILALYSLRPSFYRQWNENGRRLLLLFHCWTWPNLFFWSLPAQHHVRYSLPMCPGIVGLGVMVLLAWLKSREAPLRNSLEESAPLRKASASRLHGIWRYGISPRVAFVGILVAWCVVKIVYTEVVVPTRSERPHLQATANQLCEMVPAGETLFLCKLKDEGVLFEYGRSAQRFAWERPPNSCAYALLIEAEWQAHQSRLEVIAWLSDQQGDKIVLVRFRE